MLLHSDNSNLEMLEIFEMLGQKLRNVEIPNVETVTLYVACSINLIL